MEVCSNAHLSWNQRVQLVLPLLALAQCPISERRRATPVGCPVTLAALAANLAKQHGVGQRSLFRWYTRFLADGPLGLTRSPRRDAGTSRYFARHPQLGAFARQFLAHHAPPLLVHKALRAKCAESGIKCCAIRTVRAEAARLRAGGRLVSRTIQ